MARGVAEAIWRPISTNFSKGRPSLTRGLVLHIAVSNAASLFDYFNRPGVNVSSHFYVAYDGTLEQYVDTDDMAWCQASGNSNWISVETAGVSDGDPPGFTSAQLATLGRLYAALAGLYDLPMQEANSPSGYGLGYHAMGGAAWGGHPCPLPTRINQRDAILSIAQGGHVPSGGGTPIPTPQPDPDPNPQASPSEVDMFLMYTDGGTMLVAPGYVTGLDGEQAGQWEQVPGLGRFDATGNQRAADVIRAGALQGVPDYATQLANLQAVVQQILFLSQEQQMFRLYGDKDANSPTAGQVWLVRPGFSWYVPNMDYVALFQSYRLAGQVIDVSGNGSGNVFSTIMAMYTSGQDLSSLHAELDRLADSVEPVALVQALKDAIPEVGDHASPEETAKAVLRALAAQYAK